MTNPAATSSPPASSNSAPPAGDDPNPPSPAPHPNDVVTSQLPPDVAPWIETTARTTCRFRRFLPPPSPSRNSLTGLEPSPALGNPRDTSRVIRPFRRVAVSQKIAGPRDGQRAPRHRGSTATIASRSDSVLPKNAAPSSRGLCRAKIALAHCRSIAHCHPQLWHYLLATDH